jgi:large subunit ribosomal protein L23
MIIRPIITEKSVSDASNKIYTFEVNSDADKTAIKKEVEKTFGVKVISVKTMIQHGKNYRTGKRWMIARKSDWKKALVEIQPDKSIDLFEVNPTGK